ncbi:hypothetical protein NHX12_024298 [Muraenolepis orangiensis]|uniref:SH3 domain-binding protein 5 n=1 Tax=Muraenolepis orangiensis TaxID=630683 RepID=A0A9Q0ENW0_9TELE|nr:hypothetical protein NHX12_024298 [Muraenolepis orangiensis]
MALLWLFSPCRPYFELKAKYYLQLEQLKRRVDERQTKLAAAKAEYRTALSNLETISEEIHAQRRSHTTREQGVGSEGDGEGEGDEDIVNFKMESDGLSMLSMSMDGDRAEGAEAAVEAGLNKLTLTASAHTDDREEEDDQHRYPEVLPATPVATAILLTSGV